MRQLQLPKHLKKTGLLLKLFPALSNHSLNSRRILHMKNSLALTLMLCTLSSLLGCAPSAPLVRTETVQVPYLAPLPATLTAACPVPHLSATGPLTVQDILAWAESSSTSLQECAGRMDQIRALQPAPQSQTQQAASRPAAPAH